MIRTMDNGLVIESATTRIKFEGIRLVSLQDAATGEEFIDRGEALKVPGFQLLHQNGKVDGLGLHPLASKVHYNVLTDNIAEILLEDWECDVSVRVNIDEATGDILLEPSAWTMQGGIAGLGMNIAGIRKDLDLVAPFQQGFKGSLSHPQVQGTHANWPSMWEAAAVAFAGKDTGFSVQAWDSHYIYKGINIGHEACSQAVTLVTYARGPMEMNRCTGNLCWRISTFKGSWQVPFLRYREWYWKTYNLDEAIRLRPDWLDGLKLGISWCPTNLELLDALSKKIDPGKVFLHLPNWRPYTYDQDYPSFVPSAEGAAFIRKARAMGYHVAPHTNHCQMSPNHPLFFSSRDFCTRFPEDLRWGGWSWLPVEGLRNFGPPQSYSNMSAPTAKDWNVLVNVHLAWSPWRRHLTREVANLIKDVGIDSIFVDVVHWVHNSDNGTLENLSYAEGSLKLAREIAELAPALCVSGEGRNEITTQYLSMAQFHIYKFAYAMAELGQDLSWLMDVTVPVSELVFKGLSRGIGYSHKHGDYRRLFIDAHLQQGAIPTLIFETQDPVNELEMPEAQYILSHAGI